MKLILAFLLFTFFTTIWSYQPRSQDADWSRSFDRHGWSECPNNFYMSGMYRSGRGGTNGINHIERVRCTQATSQSSQTCRVGNWWSSFDMKGWSTCPNGHFVRGFMRTGPNRAHPDALRELEEARCCRPNNGVVRFGHCMNHNVWSSWDNAGWFHCNKGYYFVGIWRNNAGCENLGCMEQFRCCQMIAVNPCTRNNGGCQHQCRNNGGTAVCSCKPGYKLNGKACVDKKECTDGSSKCAHGCVNTVGSFKCTCKQGFTLGADAKSCKDVNECKTRNGGCAHGCVDTVGAFKCTCKQGFTLGADGKSCNDINECKTRNGGCAHGCVNTAGSFKCTCKQGFTLGADGKSCNDINECKTRNGGCAHGCVNTFGAFKCTCKQGFTLGADGKSCSAAKNPCGRNKGGCAHKCSNRNGVAKCSCRKGFNLLPNGKSCTPFNVVTEGGVTYIDVPTKRCRSVSKEECTKIAESRFIPLRRILNPNFNRFPPGCYHKTTSNVIYYNEKPSSKQCTKKRVCICKPE